MTRRFLTTDEVAALLRLSRESVRRLAAEGRLRPFRLTPRGHMRFPVEEVERLIAGR